MMNGALKQTVSSMKRRKSFGLPRANPSSDFDDAPHMLVMWGK